LSVRLSVGYTRCIGRETIAAAGGPAERHVAARPGGLRKSGGTEHRVGTKKTGKGRRKIGRKKRRMRARIRHRKG
jgi:hypothetical protein